MESTSLARAITTSALLVALMSGGGCRESDEAPPSEPVTETSSAPTNVASSPDLTGIWTVVGHHIPAISAMSDDEATAWHGRTVRLTATQAISTGNHCDEPTYTSRTAEKDSFLGTEYNLPPGSLTPLASLERLTLLEVSCGGSSWAAMGSRLIEINADHALTPWDGVFFELTRDRDFRAVGQEPGWNLDIYKGKEIRFTYDYGEREAVTPAPVPEIDPDNDASVYHAVTEANDLHVVIESSPCTDAMSGKPFESTVTVTLNGQTYHGCGEPLP